MSRNLIFALAAALALCLLAFLWGTGGLDRLAIWAAEAQRDFQNQIARTLRGLRAGTPGALIGLLTACFAYGFFHAIGPGHGKVLIGGYGLGVRVSVWRLSAISLAASLGQAVSAIVLVYAGVLVLSLGRDVLTDTADQIMAPVSYAAIGLIGLWLVWRGVRHARTAGHVHVGLGATCSTCGHAHGPTPEQVAKAGSLREAALLIAGIAIRPCTGALFVLLITWQMGIPAAGIVGTFAMAIGTALVTIATGWAAVSVRSGLLAGFSGSRMISRAVPLIEISAGLVVAAIAGGLLMRSF